MTGNKPSSSDPSHPLLTLEPLLEAVEDGLGRVGWELSGLQKTTSYEFEGRWAGESSRSAYLFFHREGVPGEASIDVFLDETSRGLKGNLALVLDGAALERLGPTREVLETLAALGRSALPPGYRTPLTLRYRLGKLDADPAGAQTEFRFKLYIPREAMESGHATVADLTVTCARAFQEILDSSPLGPLLDD